MVFPTIFKAAVAAMVLLLNMTQTNACICPAVYFTPCDYVTGRTSPVATLVVRATALSRSGQARPSDPVTYTVGVIQVFRGDTGGEIGFVTAGNFAACGIYLDLGEEYVLALDLNDDGELTVGACGLWRKWSDIPVDEKADLEAGCPDEIHP